MVILRVLFIFSVLCRIARSENFETIENDLAWLRKKEISHETAFFSTSRIHVLRLSPGEDLLESLWSYSRARNLTSASILSAVGSLQRTNIRYANQENGTSIESFFEIVSLVGNIDFQQTNKTDYQGSGHIHIACSDSEGRTIGGHLLSGNLIYTTAEITILEVVNGLFIRVLDDGAGTGSGYEELKVLKIDDKV